MKKFPMLHFILFVATFLSTLAAGAFLTGIDLFDQPRRIFEGFPFAGTLMVILLVHELSHYRAANRHGTKATLPYFIPMPMLPLGTLGAFIKMKSPIITRKALIDIGASGPIFGFIVSVIACVVGLHLSKIITITGSEGIIFGNSLLFELLSRMVWGVIPDNSDILFHPIAFAGWIGLLITSLNLIPIGQLDGGHIAYAFLGDRHKNLSIVLIVVLGVMAIFFWPGWAIWAGLMLLLGIKHPPVVYWEGQLDNRRRITGIISLIIFIITFVPTPVNVNF